MSGEKERSIREGGEPGVTHREALNGRDLIAATDDAEEKQYEENGAHEANLQRRLKRKEGEDGQKRKKRKTTSPPSDDAVTTPVSSSARGNSSPPRSSSPSPVGLVNPLSPVPQSKGKEKVNEEGLREISRSLWKTAVMSNELYIRADNANAKRRRKELEEFRRQAKVSKLMETTALKDLEAVKNRLSIAEGLLKERESKWDTERKEWEARVGSLKANLASLEGQLDKTPCTDSSLLLHIEELKRTEATFLEWMRGCLEKLAEVMKAAEVKSYNEGYRKGYEEAANGASPIVPLDSSSVDDDDDDDAEGAQGQGYWSQQPPCQK
ncbi:hypothetical protein QJS10_CPB21g00785 [Acorus calamus]|uniref:Uncharacterized protein n=1 Tax=Acorus calamus TaxID=4465 RepID=A0AAV9C8X7_ACOCL|nr:hypothetical protein QJS10_CPB21g00785 [Acorus calamus]